MYQVIKVNANLDLSLFSIFLNQKNIIHKISEQSGFLVIWTFDENNKEIILEYFNQWQHGRLIFNDASMKQSVLKKRRFWKRISWKQTPVTFAFVIICLLVSLVTFLGKNLEILRYFTYTELELFGVYVQIMSLSSTLKSHQYWRLISPIFLHFGVLHLVFNLLWLYEFGKRIERENTSFHFFSLVFLLGLVSNYCQYFFTNEQVIFGGLSGVIYGLISYCWVYQLLNKECNFHIPPGIYYFMLVWLMLGYTDFFSILGIGKIANTAHISGLLTGALIGLFFGLIFKKN